MIAWQFVPIADRAFVTMDYGPQSWADIVDGTVDSGEDFAGAVIRARVRAAAGERGPDAATIRAALLELGASQVFVEHIPDASSDRRRVEHVDEQLAPLAAVQAWCDAVDVPTEAARPLVDYTADLIAKDAA